MSYKTILVPLPDQAHIRQVLEPAILLAQKQGSHLIGLSVLPAIVIVPGSAYGAGAVIEAHRQAYLEKMGKLREIFEEMTRGQSFQSEWRHVDAGYETVTDVVIAEGRSADLIVALQDDSSADYSGGMEEPERMIIESGRPVLMVPKAGEFVIPAKRVVIAWNGRRESARAVFDALPLLKSAENVEVLWVNPQEEGDAAGDLPGTDICRALTRHGIKCDVTQNIRPAGDVGLTLLGAARANRADLLVMGCYGHSRFREFVAGGATRRVMQEMNLPVLMSH